MRLSDLHDSLLKDEEYRRAYAVEDLIHRVAERVNQLRTAQGLSQSELAELLGTKQPAISALEGGFANLTLRRLAECAYVLGCDPVGLTRPDSESRAAGLEQTRSAINELKWNEASVQLTAVWTGTMLTGKAA